ncbi:hypothetical protein EST38_g14196 [Candolleomyces aberdarensis]|uniref:CxC2-like cysteine cluster KDZ transposase-associated domain-containing protein n=1 Tax=Candolleomyces aberdarensis TaxID=2316362 RepID=A0A4Q2CYW7_9AGAR|nr:hypothetical protein EST38_g14196 [Candolleomyces aberdarensis]
MGLYPASAMDVSTVFTVSVLKHFHLLKVDAHQSTENYSTILQRLTNFIFPGETPNRKWELARVWQPWNYLVNPKQNGFGHAKASVNPKAKAAPISLTLILKEIQTLLMLTTCSPHSP